MNRRKKTIKKINLDLTRVLPTTCRAQIGFINAFQQPLSEKEIPKTGFKSTIRYREFIAGRNIAKALMQEETTEDILIKHGSTFLPIWPELFKGSVSHKGKLCGAIISNCSDILSLGLDIEKYEAISEDIWPTYTDQEEIQRNKFNDISESYLANILFSCKESAFKAFYQRGLTTVKLSDISIKLTPDTECLNMTARFQEEQALGSVLIEEDIIISCSIIDRNMFDFQNTRI